MLTRWADRNRIFPLRRGILEQKRSVRMPKKKEHPVDLTKIKPEEKLKYEVADELGLLDKVKTGGWKSLTARETGRIGGLVRQKKKADNKRKEE